MRNFILTILILFIFTDSLLAQNDSCISYLNFANKLYDDGSYEESRDVLMKVLNNCDLDKGDEIQAHKILILCYLAIDNIELAENQAAKMMKYEPNYKPDKFKDSKKYINIFSKYIPQPDFTVGLLIGMNLSKVAVTNSFSVVFPDDAAPNKYKNRSGLQFQIIGSKHIYEQFWIEAGLQYRNIKYEHDLYDIVNNTVYYSENLSFIDIPVIAKYYFTKKQIRPYLLAGANFSMLNNSLSTTIMANDKSIIDRTAYRNEFNVGYQAGVGLTLRQKNFNWSAEIRYMYNPQYINKEGTRYLDNENLFKYYYIDDDFSINNIQFNIGVSYIISYKLKAGTN